MNKVVLEMPYIKDLSVNHYLGRRKGGGYYVKQEVKDWMDGLGWTLKQFHVEDWKQPLMIYVNGVFRDKRSTPDLHNLLKVICDSIEEVSGLNDKNYLTFTGLPTIKKDTEPYLTITIEEYEKG